MIDISKLTKEDVGRWVQYETKYKKERGRLKSWNDKWIFVVYKCAGEWAHAMQYTAAATSPADLSFVDDLNAED